MAAKYKNYLGYDKRDYRCPEKAADANGVDEEDTIEYVEETCEWDEVSLLEFEFLRDKVDEMAVPLLDQHFGMFNVVQLFFAHAIKNKNTI
uniref:Uncharacterized protein n=1 Tax=Marseillevirus LCMAC101 TaxID=2506602 RepID=A0A481YQQ5_9VIRU|nr:MAG: hypothetical protein LCMAC101_01090 [Marseillevirus LCMAC101]